jgi:hypothetical protein
VNYLEFNKEELPMKYTSIALAALAVLATTAHAAPAMMSTEWAAQACDAWNKDAALTDGLAGKWIENNKGRGHKIIHLYRTDCGEATMTELKIQDKDGKAMCVMAAPCRTPRWITRSTTPCTPPPSAGTKWARANMAR